MFKLQKQAEEMIRSCGERVTSGRVEVLSMLLTEQRAVAHHEIEERLRSKHKLNRVTLYRVLEWLNKKGFVHKLVSVWRFHANTHFSHPDQHAHFECIRCTSVICLDDIKAEYKCPLPDGYQFREIELTVKGLCAACA